MKNPKLRSTMVARLVACSTVVTLAAACTAVSSVHKPLSYLQTSSPTEVWIVRRHNDSVYRITQPRLQGDTVIGFSLPRPGDPITKYEEIPINDVRQMRAKQNAPVRTAAVLVGLGTVSFIVYKNVVGGGGSGPKLGPGQPPCDCDFDEVCAC